MIFLIKVHTLITNVNDQGESIFYFPITDFRVTKHSFPLSNCFKTSKQTKTCPSPLQFPIFHSTSISNATKYINKNTLDKWWYVWWDRCHLNVPFSVPEFMFKLYVKYEWESKIFSPGFPFLVLVILPDNP